MWVCYYTCIYIYIYLGVSPNYPKKTTEMNATECQTLKVCWSFHVVHALIESKVKKPHHHCRHCHRRHRRHPHPHHH